MRRATLEELVEAMVPSFTHRSTTVALDLGGATLVAAPKARGGSAVQELHRRALGHQYFGYNHYLR
jgi:hypothetical protein